MTQKSPKRYCPRGLCTGLHFVCVDSHARTLGRTRRCGYTRDPPRRAVVETARLMTSDPTDLERLLDSGDTVTHFLETLTGEMLVAEVVRQHSVTAGSDNALGVTAGHTATHRVSVLKGRSTDVPYLYAETMFVPERLPAEVRAQLERTSDPIGRVLVAHGLKLDREPLPQSWRIGAPAPSADLEFSSEIVWSRAYRLAIDGQVVFAIHEWFLLSVLEALDRDARH